jgi:protein SCO1
MSRSCRVLASTLALAAVAACTGCGASRPSVSGPAPSPYRGVLLKAPTAAPRFALHDQAGRLVGSQSERGHWFVVAFLYTHCPDVCPLIANNLRAAMRKLPDLRVLAISVDPKGDTPAAVRGFLRTHRLPPRFRYLTGTRAQLAPVWRKFHIASTGGPKGTISHSAFELLIDPDGRERVFYDSTLHAADLEHDLPLLEPGSPKAS